MGSVSERGMIHPVWESKLPERWASPPVLMSYSTLHALETCPLRWSLSQSVYPEIWNRDGYPPRARTATLAGQIIHETLERITVAFSAASGSEADPAAKLFRVLKELGGLSNLLGRGIEDARNDLRLNPRLQQRADEVAEDLHRQLPSLRTRTQRLLSQVEWTHQNETSPITHNGSKDGPWTQSRSLGNGTHPEVSLRHPSANWYGKADLIRVTDGDCEIVDFKTGEPKEEHSTQLALYAWLWHRDRSINPQGRLATKLRVVYSNATLTLAAPGETEIDTIEAELLGRGLKARADAVNVPPDARPSRESCSLCDVRQLCQTYWQVETQKSLFGDTPDESRDIAVEVLSRQGEWSWRARVLASGRAATGEKIILRAPPGDDRFTNILESGARVRVLGVQFQEPTSDNGGVASALLFRSSEVFRAV